MSCRRKSIEALVKGYCLYATQGGIQGEIRATCPVLSRFVSQNGTSMRRLVNGKRCSSHDVPRWLSTEVVQETGRQGTEKRTNSWMYKSLLLLPPAIAAYLGTWQLERREGKIKLLEQRRAMVKENPINVFTSQGTLQEYSRVVASGRFDEENSIYIGPRPRSHMGIPESGYFIVTPLLNFNPNSLKEDAERKSVMVLRGWVPGSWKDKEHPQQHRTDSISQQATVHGVVRYSETPSMFVPENKPEEGEWHFLDVEAMARAMNLPANTPLVEVITSETDAKQSPGKSSHTAMEVLGGRRTIQSIQAEKDMETFPLAKSEGDFRQFSVMPQDHLNYALTWFSLSAATTGLAFKVIRNSLKK